MKKITCARAGDTITIGFADYPHESMLKDFYKLFKKSSSHTVIEYQESPESVVAITDNKKDSTGFGWNEDSGCFVSSGATDAKELARITWNMLCYRYAEYRDYAHLLQGIADNTNEVAPDTEPAEADEDEQDILSDITDILSLIEN